MQRIQNRALRTGKKLSVAELHEKAKFNTLSEQMDFHLMVLMHKHAKDEKIIDNTNRITRNGSSMLLNVPRSSTNKYTRAPIYKGSVMWNELPTRVREAQSILAFKNIHIQWWAVRASKDFSAGLSTIRFLNLPFRLIDWWFLYAVSAA